MATYEEEEDIHRTLSAGARGYVLKAGRPEYIQAVRTAAGRESLLSSGNYFEIRLVAMIAAISPNQLYRHPNASICGNRLTNLRGFPPYARDNFSAILQLPLFRFPAL
jgi:DNA-binding NarL/FixJ family response regulator